MTDNEIIKALECCQRPVGSGACNDCPLKSVREKRLSHNDKSCTTIMLEGAIDIITRQKAEIERLKGWQDLLKAEKHSLIKVEAIKEFAERLCEDRLPNDPVVIAVKTELKMMQRNGG